MTAIRTLHGTGIAEVPDGAPPGQWTAAVGPPVPVAIEAPVWQALLDAARTTPDPARSPRVFRLFMPRGRPREVVAYTEIEGVTRTERGILRWVEGPYPALSEPMRKGGNAFVRGDVDLRPDDAWWMGREQTDLRILLRRSQAAIEVAAWWARAGVDSGGQHLTDGELLPVRLLVRA